MISSLNMVEENKSHKRKALQQGSSVDVFLVQQVNLNEVEVLVLKNSYHKRREKA